MSLISENWQAQLIPRTVLCVLGPRKAQALHISAGISHLIGGTWHFIKILVLLLVSAVRRFMRYYKTEADTCILKLSRPNLSHEYGFSSSLSPSPTKGCGITKLMLLIHWKQRKRQTKKAVNDLKNPTVQIISSLWIVSSCFAIGFGFFLNIRATVKKQ